MPDTRDVTRERPAVLGPITEAEAAHTRLVIGGALSTVEHPADRLRLRLSRHGGLEACPPVVVAQVNVTVRARMIRVQAAAPTLVEAVDQAGEALLHRLQRLDRHLTAERTGDVGFTAADWTSPYPQNPVGPVGPPTEQGRIVRMKDCHLAVQSPDSAAFAMDLRDYPFHLFVDDSTGVDALIHRGGPTGYRLHFSATVPAPRNFTVPISIQRWPAVPMPITRAVGLLNIAPERPYLFFTDPRTRRGRVLYRRFDGHLGLLAPIW
ncbi:sigma 54 modulation/S30EA ribosomal C-terminal domain-containing protein [Actinoplanes sp. NPDC023801]|uniref:sigma 54 modulation/S30EA ribosomal C-terminal domain-containing protein n=1 Tax=Actinoplanes sp. NPDC023801 TaxID=3154595 RepID=UPI0033C58013